MEKNKWIITGAAGFLGSHVIEQLLQKEQTVLGIDDLSWGKESHVENLKRKGAFERVDIRDHDKLKNVIEKFEPTHIVHLAALHFIPDAIKNPTLAVDINVKGTQSLLHAARDTKYSHFFFASTGDVYEKTDKDNKEDQTEVRPFNIYGLTKLFGEKLLEQENINLPSKNFVIGRIYNLIGPRETNPHIIPEIMKQLKDNPRKLSLGNITPVRDYVPVDECARTIIELCQKSTKPLARYNIATGVGQSVEDLIKTIEVLLGHKIDVEKDPKKVRTVERERLVASVDRLKEFLGWTPTHNVSHILQQLLIVEGLLKK